MRLHKYRRAVSRLMLTAASGSALLLLAAVASAQDKLPPLEIERLYNAGDTPVGDLRKLTEGKPVVLEFWATWCAPCVAAMPRLSQLADAYSGRVQFISITAETPRTVESFLRRRRPAGWVAVDTDESVVKALNVSEYPTTYLITSDRRYAKIELATLTTDVLDSLVNGHLPAPAPSDTPAVSVEASTSPSVARAPELRMFDVARELKSLPKPTVELSAATPAIMKYTIKSDQHIAAVSMSSRELYAAATGLNSHEIIGPDSLLNLKWRVRVAVASKADLRRLVLAALDSALNVRSAQTVMASPVWLLRAPMNLRNAQSNESGASGLERSSSKDEARSGQTEGAITATAYTIDDLAESLSTLLGQRVINETRLKGKWSWTLTWPTTGSPSDALPPAVSEQLGLQLVPSAKIIPALELTPRR